MPALAHHLAIAGIVGAVLLRYLYEQHRERQRELAESQARLQALQARIRPHFLFNSMNTIASLTRVDPDLAEQVVEDLSDLFRATLSDAQTLSTLAREIELAEVYLRIEPREQGAGFEFADETVVLLVDSDTGRVAGRPLLAELLPEDRVINIPGGHDYATFKALWDRFLESRVYLP